MLTHSSHSSDEKELPRLTRVPGGHEQSKEDSKEPIVPELVLFSSEDTSSAEVVMISGLGDF